MRLYIEILEGGDASGQKFSLEETTSLGRSGADIEISDPKLSGVHATFEFKENEGWFVVDNQSRNGVWVNGLREVRVLIKDGDQIQMGGVFLVCRLVEARPIKFSDPFQHWAQSLVKKVKNTPPPLSEIRPEMRLRFTQGVQYGETVDIFYGPRHVGRGSLDIPIYDKEAPVDCFRIDVKRKYAYFSTDQEKLVKINDQSVKQKQFQPDDVVSVGDTKILVEFDE